jgi:hypothetical protein
MNNEALKEKLRNGEITTFQYLECLRTSLPIVPTEFPEREKISEEEKAMGITSRMRSYCRKHNLADIPDLKVVWRKPKRNYIWNVGKKIAE